MDYDKIQKAINILDQIRLLKYYMHDYDISLHYLYEAEKNLKNFLDEMYSIKSER